MAKKKSEFIVSNPLSENGLLVNLDSCEVAQGVLRSFLHPLRQKFLKIMDSSKEKKVSVTTIFTKLKIEQSVASQHLAILRASNLVIAERSSREVLYSVNYETLKAMGISASVIAEFVSLKEGEAPDVSDVFKENIYVTSKIGNGKKD
jgi:DNA-binding transcriptional ArsR family regulator